MTVLVFVKSTLIKFSEEPSCLWLGWQLLGVWGEWPFVDQVASVVTNKMSTRRGPENPVQMWFPFKSWNELLKPLLPRRERVEEIPENLTHDLSVLPLFLWRHWLSIETWFLWKRKLRDEETNDRLVKRVIFDLVTRHNVSHEYVNFK